MWRPTTGGNCESEPMVGSLCFTEGLNKMQGVRSDPGDLLLFQTFKMFRNDWQGLGSIMWSLGKWYFRLLGFFPLADLGSWPVLRCVANFPTERTRKTLLSAAVCSRRLLRRGRDLQIRRKQRSGEDLTEQLLNPNM